MKLIENKFQNFWLYLMPLIIAGLTFVFLEQTQIIGGMPGYYLEPFDLISSLLLATIIISLISATTFFLVKRVRLSKNGFILILVLAGVLLYTVYNIIMMPLTQVVKVLFLDSTQHEVSLSIQESDKIIGILVVVINFLFIIFMVLVLPSHAKFRKFVVYISILLIIIGFSGLVYSLVFEFTKYIDIVRFGALNSYDGVPESFFGNRNPYASFLLTSQAFLAFLYYVNMKSNKRVWFIIAMIPLVTGIHFTFSKTNISLSYIIIFALFYRHLFLLFKTKKIRFFIELFISSAFLVSVVAFRFAPSLTNSFFGVVAHNLLPRQLFLSGQSTMKSRFNLWHYALTLIGSNPQILLLGQGTHISRLLYFQRMQFELTGAVHAIGYGDYHNGFIEIFHTFGLVGLLIYISFFAGALSVIWRRTKADHGISYFLLASAFVFLARSQTESLAALLFKSEGIVASLAFILPFLFLTTKSNCQRGLDYASAKENRFNVEAVNCEIL